MFGEKITIIMIIIIAANACTVFVVDCLQKCSAPVSMLPLAVPLNLAVRFALTDGVSLANGTEEETWK